MKKHLLRALALSSVPARITKIILLGGLCLTSIVSQAQFVTIPDAAFVTWLTGYYPSAMNGNQMDTTDYQITHATDIGCENQGIQDLYGIQFFDALQRIDFGNNQVGNLPPHLPSTLLELNGFHNGLASLPPLPAGLQKLYIDNNQLTAVPTLPAGLAELSCALNLLTGLPASLPAGLTLFSCGYNQISSLPTLPTGLVFLECSNMNLTALPALPNTITHLDCGNNAITGVQITPALSYLDCKHTLLTSLPALPATLQHLDCSYDSLTYLPALPNGLVYLDCQYNKITGIADFPDSLAICYIAYNPISCLPPLKKIAQMFWYGTQVTCLPNYGHVNTSGPSVYTFPLCNVYNANGCAFYNNISGTVYFDANNNCIHDAGDSAVNNINVNLWSGANLVEQTTTHYNGQYAFDLNAFGTYTITVDTSDFPFTISCPASGVDTSVNTVLDSIHTGNDFAVVCKPGFDLIAKSIYGRFRPGSLRWVNMVAGDNSNFYGVHCAAGVSGTVVVTITGAAHYSSPAYGAVTPSSVSGNTITWNVADFGTVNMLHDFNFFVAVDTNAVLGQTICFTLTVNPIAGDYNPVNNVLTQCIIITVSCDPNEKDANPATSVDVSQQWLTYTINFQNTGTDTALNIYVDDTLDTNVDPSSLQLLAYSHDPLVQIKDNAVRFNFPHINLPDSNTNEPASHGYVQYKVKLKDNLPLGTNISNTAYIYFDFNAPVVTNTTSNTITTATGIKDFELRIADFGLNPNPASESVSVTIDESLIGSNLIITDITGREVMRSAVQIRNPKFAIQNFSPGVYFLTLENEKGRTTKKLVIQK